MLTITTTNNLDGYEVVEYLGIVTGEAVSGINMFRDIGAGLRNVFGGRSAGYEDNARLGIRKYRQKEEPC